MFKVNFTRGYKKNEGSYWSINMQEEFYNEKTMQYEYRNCTCIEFMHLMQNDRRHTEWVTLPIECVKQDIKRLLYEYAIEKSRIPYESVTIEGGA